jgi:glycosyltransferase involved in cell wall biosynthesis
MPQTYWNTSHRKACTNMFQYWPSFGRDTHIFCHQATTGLKSQWSGRIHTVTPAMLPDNMVAVLQRRIPPTWLDQRLEKIVSRNIRPREIVICWPGVSGRTIKMLKEIGAVVAVEFINTHRQYSHKILSREYGKLGLEYNHRVSPKTIEADNVRIREADLIFCPNAFVEESITQAAASEGIDIKEKLISSSRGTYLKVDQSPRKLSKMPIVFIFVGEFGVRKGGADIVRAMKDVGPAARLLVAGKVAPDFRAWIEKEGLPDNIEMLGFVKDIGEVYARSDALLFPSLEEGGPKVCYEAAAYGLPMIVTEMGGGRIARDGETGYIVPPSDPTALAAAMRKIVSNGSIYEEMSRKALKNVSRFSWEAIARDRHIQLLTRDL